MNNIDRVIGLKQLSLDIEHERLKQEIIDKEKRNEITASEAKQRMAELNEYYQRMTEHYTIQSLNIDIAKLCVQLISKQPESRP